MKTHDPKLTSFKPTRFKVSDIIHATVVALDVLYMLLMLAVAVCLCMCVTCSLIKFSSLVVVVCSLFTICVEVMSYSSLFTDLQLVLMCRDAQK